MQLQDAAYRLIDQEDLHVTRIRGCVRVSAEEIRRFEHIIMEIDQ